MLPPQLKFLEGKRIILASGSPRRRDILSKLDLEFQVIPSTFPETLDKSQFKTPQDYVIENAKCKGIEIRDRQDGKVDLVISADTVVVLNGNEILEKPQNTQEAKEMLQKLSGKSHQVITGVVLLFPHGKLHSFHEISTVDMGSLSEEMVDWYIGTGEPFDKAGGYGYQSLGMTLVKAVHGCYYNIVGFPLFRVLQELALHG